jgi:cob(I)alamin adenosyltransferase
VIRLSGMRTDEGGVGRIHVYTGDGKGKTTAALGLCLRAWGHGRRVQVVQFMKGRIDYGELLAARKMEGLDIEQYGRPDFVNPKDPDPEDVRLAGEGLERALELLKDPSVDLLVLDEVNLAVSWGLVNGKRVVDGLKGRPAAMEVVLTGREAPEELLELADYITEMREVRHPFQGGTLARKGVEF